MTRRMKVLIRRRLGDRFKLGGVLKSVHSRPSVDQNGVPGKGFICQRQEVQHFQ